MLKQLESASQVASNAIKISKKTAPRSSLNQMQMQRAIYIFTLTKVAGWPEKANIPNLRAKLFNSAEECKKKRRKEEAQLLFCRRYLSVCIYPVENVAAVDATSHAICLKASNPPQKVASFAFSGI